MPAPDGIKALVSQFDEHIETYKRANYNETQLRREFLDPFFVQLGWDVFNTEGYAGDYKDVVHEAAIKVGGTTKAPDYSFRIGGQRKFFVEAKKPSVDVKGDPHPAFQLRRYAWTAGLPVSILTDFEEFAVYDCRIKPDRKDKASTARIMYMTFREYDARWNEIADVFGKTAILKGAFDKYAAKKSRKRGTAEVDAEFLKELERWRTALARNIARHNSLSARQLNHAVQLIIDRIVFLRICEDRGIEPAGTLLALASGDQIYDRLSERFRHADAKYNSGLFHFKRERGRDAPDTLTPSLHVGDSVLKDIIKHLYYPDAPYEFSVLPADILGHIYERFLGSIITLSATGKTAKVEEKPEVRKAGGVYYTPTYIVDYIVGHTIGELLKDRRLEKKRRGKARGPAMNKPLRVLDPACGSGSFLLGAYQYLLDWHLKQYAENDPDSWAKLPTPPIAHRAVADEKATAGDYKLTTHEKKRILTAHIFGVDIDAQAVEVTKLSLLLKVLEGESEESLEPVLFAKERALPDLSSNIKCGNSLVGPDFYRDQGTLFDLDEQYRINAFDWSVEFEAIMNAGGFDAVIGNPPWLVAGYYAKASLEYLRQRYATATGKFDLYYLFVEKGRQLTHSAGMFGMIIPNKFFHTRAARALRGLLANQKAVRSLVDFGDSKVFEGATNYSCIVLLTQTENEEISFLRARKGLDVSASFTIECELLFRELWSFHPRKMETLFDRMRDSGTALGELVARFGTGVQTGADRILILKPTQSKDIEEALLHPIRRGRDVRRYWAHHDVNRLLLPYEVVEKQYVVMNERTLRDHPLAYEYLSDRCEPLAKRVWFGKSAAELSGAWYGMMYLDSYAAFARPHILTPSLSDQSNFALGDGTLFVTGTAGVTSIIPSDDMNEDIHYLLGLLNSKLLSVYATSNSPIFSGGYRKFSGPYLKQLPIRMIEFDRADDETAHDRIVALVRSMLDMHTRLHGDGHAKMTPQERRVLEGRIAAADHEIDQIVYEIYGLTDEEVALVETARAG